MVGGNDVILYLLIAWAVIVTILLIRTRQKHVKDIDELTRDQKLQAERTDTKEKLQAEKTDAKEKQQLEYTDAKEKLQAEKTDAKEKLQAKHTDAKEKKQLEKTDAKEKKQLEYTDEKERQQLEYTDAKEKKQLEYTDEKEKQLHTTSAYTRSLIEASLDPLVTISPEGKVTDVNEATIKITGVPRENLVDSDFSDYFTEPKKAREGYERVFKEGFVADYPLSIRNSSGQITDVLYNASVYKDDKGNVLGVFAAARDITERKKVEKLQAELTDAKEKKQLEKTDAKEKKQLEYTDEKERQQLEYTDAKEKKQLEYTDEKERLQLEKTDEKERLQLEKTDAKELSEKLKGVAKDEFSAMVTHELKTPLVPIIGYCKMFKTSMLGRLDQEQLEAIEIIEKNAKRLENLITDIMDVRKLDLDQMKFKIDDLSLGEFFSSLDSDYKRILENKGCQFTTNLYAKNLVCKTDKARLRQVFDNLISNAIKVVPVNKGKIETGFMKENNNLIFYVKDNGIGIPLEIQKELFQKFYQIDTSERRSIGGTGLGLAISKGIVEKLGGIISVESDGKTGTIFYMKFPLEL